jgi:hypothetical protein
VKVCDERVEQFEAVQVNVRDSRGSSGSVWTRWVWGEVVDGWDKFAGAERDGEGVSIALVVLRSSSPSMAGDCTPMVY